MGAELLRMYVSTTIMVCYRSVTRHPFVVGMIIVLYSMYRLFPLLFSLLVSASPVVVSTAFLLGTLLSYGQPNIPEIEIETEKESDVDEVRKSETKLTSGSEVGRGRDEGLIEVADISLDGTNMFVESDNRVVDLVNDGELRFGEERLVEDEKVVLGSRYSPLQQSESDDKLWEGSPDPLNTNGGLLWKHMEGDHHDDGDDDDDDNDDDDDDDDDDSGDSDLAESSSPDASMADIIPMLDELHPLLSEERETREVPQTLRDDIIDDDIDAVSEHSLESSDTGSESNDDIDDGDGIEKREDLEDGDDDGKDKESKHVEKEYETRSAILWTEYDQKNLMNLGTSEMERNRRLENLIARRRARKTMRMQAEKNLIDLESTDIPWNIPPISTARINPFDYDTNDNIPGSAPSVLLKRRNPFDLPYDSSEEKPDLVGDTFQQEFAAIVQPKEPFFRRHESFNVGPSSFGAFRSERQESRLKPYFVPERSFAEFQRQFSGLSDSKASSVPDTESDFESKDHNEEDEEMVSEKDHENVSDDVSHRRPYFVPEHLASDQTNFSSFQRQLSEVSESKVSSVPDTESVSSASDDEIKDHNGDEHSFEVELFSVQDNEQASEMRDNVSKHASQASESVEDDAEVESVQVPKEDEGVDNENELNVGNATNQREIISSNSDNEGVIQLNSGDVELHSRRSSLSSTDEVSDQVFNEKEEDDDDEAEVATLVPETTYFVDRSNSIDTSDTDVTSLLVEENHPNEPIYDLSPRSVTRNLSSNSTLNDLHKDESFQHSENQHESSSSVADVKLNSTDYGPETTDAQNQLPSVLHDEEHLLTSDNVLTSLTSKSVSEVARDVQLDTDASHHHEELLQGGQLKEGPVASSNSKIVHEETHETLHQLVSEGEATSQPHKEVLLNTSMNKSEENPCVLQVQNTSNNLDNLQIPEPGNIVLRNINSASGTESEVVEVVDTGTQAPGCPSYASDSHNDIDDNEIKEIDDDLLVELDAVGDFSIKNSGSSTFNEMKDDESLELEHDHESKATADEESHSKHLESVLDEVKKEPNDLEIHDSVDGDSTYFKDLGSTQSDVKMDLQASDHDLETKDSVGEDSYSKDLGSTFDEKKQDVHASDERDLETKCYGDEDSDKDSGSTLNEIKNDTLASDHGLETNRSIDEDSDSEDIGSTLNEMQRDPRVSDHDLVTLDYIEQHPHMLKHDHLETNGSVDDDSYSNDLESTFTEMRRDPQQASDHHRLEAFYSVDENFIAKHTDSTLNETKRDIQASERDFEATRSDDEMDTEVKKSYIDKEVSKVEDEASLEAEASKIKLINDTSEVLLPEETESSSNIDHALSMDKA